MPIAQPETLQVSASPAGNNGDKPAPEPKDQKDRDKNTDPVLDEIAFENGVIQEWLRVAVPPTVTNREVLLAMFLPPACVSFGTGAYVEVGEDRHPPRINSIIQNAEPYAGANGAFLVVRESFATVTQSLASENLTVPTLPLRIYSELPEDFFEGTTPTALVFRQLTHHDRLAGLAGLARLWHSRGPEGSPRTAHVAVIVHEPFPPRVGDDDRAQLFRSLGPYSLCAIARPTVSASLPPPFASLAANLLFVPAMKAAIRQAEALGAVGLDAKATALWKEWEPQLRVSKGGLVGRGMVYARAMVLRLALIYMLFECKREIGVDHLRAARAIWKYSTECLERLVGGRLSDERQQRVLDFLEVKGGAAKESEIYREVSGGTEKAYVIQRDVLRPLAVNGYIFVESKRSVSGKGRPAKVWTLVGSTDPQPALGDGASGKAVS